VIAFAADMAGARSDSGDRCGRDDIALSDENQVVGGPSAA